MLMVYTVITIAIICLSSCVHIACIFTYAAQWPATYSGRFCRDHSRTRARLFAPGAWGPPPDGGGRRGGPPLTCPGAHAGWGGATS
eukprot:7436701-Lingulodinium_polyedra.AAC.1